MASLLLLQGPHLYYRACHGAGGAVGPVSGLPPHPPLTDRALAGPAGGGGPHLQQLSGGLLRMLMAASGWAAWLMLPLAGWPACRCSCHSSGFQLLSPLPDAPCRSSIGCCAAHALEPGCSLAAPQHRQLLRQEPQPPSRQRRQQQQQRRRAPVRLLSRSSTSSGSASSESACKRSCQALGTTTMSSEGRPAFPGHGNVRAWQK
jgi:hypothetical protein